MGRLERDMLTAAVVITTVLILAAALLCHYGVKQAAEELTALGYEAKVVGYNCYAKVDNRWITCDAAVSNVRDVHIKE
jgi:hypothetical protein